MMTYEEKLDCILTELAKVNDASVSFNDLMNATKIQQNELDRLLMILGLQKYIIYYPPMSEAIIHEFGRDFIEKKGGFVSKLKHETEAYTLAKDGVKFSKSAVFWAKIAALLAVISIIVSLKDCSVKFNNKDSQTSDILIKQAY